LWRSFDKQVKNPAMSKGNALLGFVSGLAAGAVLGLLLAPAKGSETRQKISTKGTDLAESLKAKFDEFIDDLTQSSSQAKTETTDCPEQ